MIFRVRIFLVLGCGGAAAAAAAAAAVVFMICRVCDPRFIDGVFSCKCTGRWFFKVVKRK